MHASMQNNQSFFPARFGYKNWIAALNVEPGTPPPPPESSNNNSDPNRDQANTYQNCKAEYPRMVKYCLWLLAEIAIIAADIPEGFLLFNSSFTS
ncbi:hypothetical protein PVK06_021615 [Gossypium arboreum]|uniref:Uncharacterized protein n=1 Tax=Gossypium arboreum TaxID=29729 RepID=A0ABR0PQH2_GOSAR|nr:hypothetical protein PVK06_021615 [Gossypium arboreum]